MGANKPRPAGRRVLPAVLALLAACGSGENGPPASGSGGASSPGDAAAVLSSDPVDQINVILAQAATVIPGESREVRYQIRLLPGDSVAVDFQEREVSGPWHTQGYSVAALGGFHAENTQGPFVDFLCEQEDCFENRAPLDGLDLARLPPGAGRERFLGMLTRLAGGETTVEAEGGVDEINRLLRESAVSFSETVSSWYQVSFAGDWMDVVTWQHTEGFTEHALPRWRKVHLPTLGPVGASDPVPCLEPGCVLDVAETPLRLIPPTPEDAQRLAALINGLAESGG